VNWEFVGRPSLSGVTDVLRVYLNCIRVLRAIGDERSGPLLQKAQDLLQKRADRITNDDHRRAYLEATPTNSDISKLYGLG
jgi:hypothetical protein